MLDLMYVICRIYMYVQNISAILYKNTSHSRLHIWKGLTIISLHENCSVCFPGVL